MLVQECTVAGNTTESLELELRCSGGNGQPRKSSGGPESRKTNPVSSHGLEGFAKKAAILSLE